MAELVDTYPYPDGLVKLEGLEGEFEARIGDSSTLAFRVAYAVLRNREDAEDAAQEAFVRACGSFRLLRDRARFRSWLVRTTWRLALNRQRSNRRRERREQTVAEQTAADPPLFHSVEEAAASREFQEHLWRAVDALSGKLRAVVVLSAIEGHELGEIAEILNLPEGTVKSRLHLARRSLAEKLRWVVKVTRQP